MANTYFCPMFFPLAKGLLFGIGMSLMLGTVFFSLIQNSIAYGWKKGILIAIGVVSSDLIFITLAVLGVNLIEADERNPFIHGGAVLVLLFLGINLLIHRKPKVININSRLGNAMYFFSNGFLLNVLNPVNFLFWAGLATLARADWGYENFQLKMFFAGCLISIFLTEGVLAILAHRIKPYLNETLLRRINQVTGVAFVGIGLYLIVDFFIHYS
jgi:L-lysine exporter family protein LysE/ArgO